MADYGYDYAAGASAALQNQQAQYQDFQNNMPYYQGLIGANAAAGAQNSFQGQKQGIDSNANSRGLLYSGLHDQAIAGAAASAGNQQQQAIYQGNVGLSNLNNQYENSAINAGLNNYQGQVAQNMGNYSNDTSKYYNNLQAGNQLFGSVAGIGAMGLMSDENAKKDIKDENPKKLMLVMDKIEPKSFKYKDEEHGEGEQHGLLAQDLEKSDIGKNLVEDTDEGKKIDIAKSVGLLLALQSLNHKRLQKVGA